MKGKGEKKVYRIRGYDGGRERKDLLRFDEQRSFQVLYRSRNDGFPTLDFVKLCADDDELVCFRRSLVVYVEVHGDCDAFGEVYDGLDRGINGQNVLRKI